MGEVAAAVGLAEGEPGVRAVLDAVARLEPVSTRRLSRAVDLPVPIVASVCGELRKRSVVSERRPTQLTALGRTLFAAGGLGLGRVVTCPTCAGRGIPVLAELGGVAADLAVAAQSAPPPRLDLDQCHCTVGTKLRRALALHEAGALVGRRVLLLGDDDLVSVTISSLVRRFGSASAIASLTVVDVDPAVVAYVERELAGAPFPVACIQHDLREPPRAKAGARVRHRGHRPAVYRRSSGALSQPFSRSPRRAGKQRLLLVRLAPTRGRLSRPARDRRARPRDPPARAGLQRLRRRGRSRRDEPPVSPRRDDRASTGRRRALRRSASTRRKRASDDRRSGPSDGGPTVSA